MPSVLITGCSSGFGLLTAQTFARRGHTVFATVRALDTAGALQAARDAEGLPISILPLDVQDTASVNATVSAALDSGALDVLVNNADFALRGPVEEMDDDELLRQFDTNVFGVVRLIRAVAPTMREQGAGTIVNVSSIVASLPPPFSGVYAASKAAVTALSQALHYELAPFGIRVVLLEPGPYPTRLYRNEVTARHHTPSSPYVDDRQRYDAAVARVSARLPPAAPQEVAEAIYAAATAEQPRFRHVLGSGAQQLDAARQSTDFEGFERIFRNLLDWPVEHRAPARVSIAGV